MSYTKVSSREKGSEGGRDARFPPARERRGLGGTAGGRGDGLHALLKQYFGYDGFRPRQEEIIANALAGQHGMVIMPTGGGKSLCYQLPALAVNGLTLVVSPLIALMKDQVDGLQANGIAAGFINSSLNAVAISRVQQMAEDGALRVLYVAPERIGMPAFQRFLARLDVSLIAIDEAHCISEWGHDFRPDYRNLAELRDRFPRYAGHGAHRDGDRARA